MAASPVLIDSFHRLHDNLRISVTDRCNIRCFYCMPEHPVEFMPRAEILSFEEIERFVRMAAGLGVRKVRVTGGEPLVRKDLPVLIERLAAIDGIDDLALTTNGVLLADLAQPALRRRPPPHQHPPRHARPRTLLRDHSPTRPGPGPRRDRGLPPHRLRSDQDQCRGRQGPGRAGSGAAGPVRAGARTRSPLHRVHAARCTRPLVARQGPARRRHRGAAVARGRRRSSRSPTDRPTRRPPSTDSPTAVAGSASSAR